MPRQSGLSCITIAVKPRASPCSSGRSASMRKFISCGTNFGCKVGLKESIGR